jgi:thiol-disulfide isomerase/thioredoxin
MVWMFGGFALARRGGVAVVMLVAVMLLVWAGVYNLRARRAAMLKAAQNEVVLTKTDSPGSEGDAMASMMGVNLRGKAAPGFTLVDLSGKKVSLSDFKGHPVVVNFWATYCGPCKLEMPWFQEMSAKYQAQGLVVLGLDQDEGEQDEVIAKAAKKVGVSYPILLPDSKAAKAYQLGDYLPETFYVGKDGRVVEQTVGAHAKDEIEADIQKAVAAGGA